MQNNDWNQIEAWEYSLRQFIHIATRWGITGVHAQIMPQHPFSPVFTHHISNARTEYENFRIGLRNELSRLTNQQAFGIDLKDRFLPMIENYKRWYREHSEETKIFGEYNPYALMWNVIESTEHEILKYFPAIVITSETKPAPPISAPKLTAVEIQAKRNLENRVHETLATLDSLNLPERFWDSSIEELDEQNRQAEIELRRRLFEKYGEPHEGRINCFLGRDAQIIRHPQTAGRAWEYLVSYNAPCYLFHLVKQQRKDVELVLVAREELDKIDACLAEADAVSHTKASEYRPYGSHDKQWIMIRVKRYLVGYYEQDGHLPGLEIGSVADVFTEYFVWPEFLRRYVLGERKAEMQAGEAIQPEKKLSLAQTALLRFYLNQPVTKTNADEIAKQFGHKSGQNLAKRYANFKKGSNERTSGKLAVINLERVLLELDGNTNARRLAEDELKIARQLKT